jgi:DNA replication and repair protein RecF
MAISSIIINNFRCFNNLKLDFSFGNNFFYGLNGSGKTSLLECLFFLSRGCSFKQPHSKKLISFSSDNFNLFSTTTNNIKIGVLRSRTDKLSIKINDNYIFSSFILTKYITLQVLSPDSYLLIDSSPIYRRKYLDWIVFHVKHSLFTKWKRYKEILRNRNIALKKRLNFDEVNAWDYELIVLTNEISNYRFQFIDRINQLLFSYKDSFLESMDIKLEYYPGWKLSKDYKDVLADNQSKDRLLGYTQFGIHKAEFSILVKLDNKYHLVKDVLSNGLIKYLSMFLYILQIYIYIENKDSIEEFNLPIILIDDISSQLDNVHSSMIFNFLNLLHIQIFITMLDTSDNRSLINNLKKDKDKMFHVKQNNTIEEK